jgi:hypothetical protein
MRMDPGRIDHGSSGVSLSYSLKHLKKIVQCILEEEVGEQILALHPLDDF